MEKDIFSDIDARLKALNKPKVVTKKTTKKK